MASSFDFGPKLKYVLLSTVVPPPTGGPLRDVILRTAHIDVVWRMGGTVRRMVPRAIGSAPSCAW